MTARTGAPSFSQRPRSADLRPVDLTGRERHLRAAMQAMALVAAKFARAARRTLPFLVRRRARLSPQAVSLAAVGHVTGPTDAPRFEIRLESDDGPAWATLSVNGHALSILLESALGGGDGGEAAPLGAELSLAQSALVARIARSLAADFAAAVRSEVGLVLSVVSARAARAGEAGDSGDVDGLAVDCVFDGLTDSAAISVTVSAEALETAAREHAEVEAPVAADPRMTEAINEIPVEVAAELGSVTLGLRQVLALRVGQVLRLPTAVDDPVPVRVAGLRKFDAVPIISRGQLSVQIRGRHEE